MLLASLISAARPASDAVHAIKGQEPPHLTKARLRAETQKAKLAAQQAKAEKRRVRPADGKPTIGDVARVYLGDAFQDVIDAHDRRRAEKKAQKQENTQAIAEQRPARQVRPGWKQRVARAWQLLTGPVGDKPDSADQNGPATPSTVVEKVKDALDVDATDGPIITCDECGARLVDAAGGWAHPTGSACGKADRIDQAATAPAVAEPAAPQQGPAVAGLVCPRCEKTVYQLDFEHGACRSCVTRTGSVREFWERHVNEAKNAYHNGDWVTADRHLAAIEAHLPAVYRTRHGDLQAYIRTPEADRRFNNGYQRLFLPAWRADIQQRINTDATPTEGDTMTDITSVGSATGDAYDVETALNECNLLGDDLGRIDTALDTIDEAITNAGAAAEKIEAFLASKSIDDCAVGGMSTARDMLSAERIKALIDAVAAAKAGVRAAEDELRRLQDLGSQLNGADGSVLNGR